MLEQINWAVLHKQECSRTYVWAEGISLHIRNAIKIGVQTDGTQHIEIADGKKYIVKPNWVYVSIDSGDKN